MDARSRGRRRPLPGRKKRTFGLSKSEEAKEREIKVSDGRRREAVAAKVNED